MSHNTYVIQFRVLLCVLQKFKTPANYNRFVSWVLYSGDGSFYLLNLRCQCYCNEMSPKCVMKYVVLHNFITTVLVRMSISDTNPIHLSLCFTVHLRHFLSLTSVLMAVTLNFRNLCNYRQESPSESRSWPKDYSITDSCCWIKGD